MANVVLTGPIIIYENAFAGNFAIETITFSGEGQVIIGGSAFAGCTNLTTVTFTSTTPCLFVGLNTFKGCLSDLVIYVPEGAFDAYKQSAMIDSVVSEKIAIA